MLDEDQDEGPLMLRKAHERIRELRQANLLLTRQARALRTDADRLAEALRLTQEYVGSATLPPTVGWEWYDALKLHYGPDWEPS